MTTIASRSRSARVTASSSSKSFPSPRRGKATSTTNPMKVFTVFASRKDTPPPFTTKAATKTTRLNAVLEPEQQRQQNNGDNINAERAFARSERCKTLDEIGTREKFERLRVGGVDFELRSNLDCNYGDVFSIVEVV